MIDHFPNLINLFTFDFRLLPDSLQVNVYSLKKKENRNQVHRKFLLFNLFFFFQDLDFFLFKQRQNFVARKRIVRYLPTVVSNMLSRTRAMATMTSTRRLDSRHLCNQSYHQLLSGVPAITHHLKHTHYLSLIK